MSKTRDDLSADGSPQSKGDRARADNLTSERRSEIASDAAHRRWAKRDGRWTKLATSPVHNAPMKVSYTGCALEIVATLSDAEAVEGLIKVLEAMKELLPLPKQEASSAHGYISTAPIPPIGPRKANDQA